MVFPKADKANWGFYGRTDELGELDRVFRRNRFFFVRVTGRRRIGKTTLVQQALKASGRSRFFYVQIPDSADAGVVSAVRDAMDTFDIPASTFPRPSSLHGLASTVEALIRAGYVVALDEFQYFSRKHLHPFLSVLQSAVDRLLHASEVQGGLIVLGSLHAELVALLDDRDAPLYNRTTDAIELQHLDIRSVLGILDAHASRDPERLLFLWNLFEGVPKFYRDCFEQDALGESRRNVIERMFLRSSSPLRTEADSWFLSELRGRYDVALKYVARHPGCSHGDIEAHIREVSANSAQQAGGYLQILANRYRLLERRLPIFAKATARNGRYYIRDNFLRSWLAALQSNVSAMSFRPIEVLLKQADSQLASSEGEGFERLVAQLYAERSRRRVGDFSMTQRVQGYWDKRDTEIDLVLLDGDSRTIRFGTCKRDADRLRLATDPLRENVKRFLDLHAQYQSWTHQFVACAPAIDVETRAFLQHRGFLVEDLGDLSREL